MTKEELDISFRELGVSKVSEDAYRIAALLEPEIAKLLASTEMSPWDITTYIFRIAQAVALRRDVIIAYNQRS